MPSLPPWVRVVRVHQRVPHRAHRGNWDTTALLPARTLVAPVRPQRRVVPPTRFPRSPSREAAQTSLKPITGCSAVPRGSTRRTLPHPRPWLHAGFVRCHAVNRPEACYDSTRSDARSVPLSRNHPLVVFQQRVPNESLGNQLHPAGNCGAVVDPPAAGVLLAEEPCAAPPTGQASGRRAPCRRIRSRPDERRHANDETADRLADVAGGRTRASRSPFPRRCVRTSMTDGEAVGKTMMGRCGAASHATGRVSWGSPVPRARWRGEKDTQH